MGLRAPVTARARIAVPLALSAALAGAAPGDGAAATCGLSKPMAVTAAQMRKRLARHKKALVIERRRQAAAVTAMAAHRGEIERELAKRRALIASVHGEVRRLQAAEAARQARLA